MEKIGQTLREAIKECQEEDELIEQGPRLDDAEREDRADRGSWMASWPLCRAHTSIAIQGDR
eukprot:5546069-Pyramimonas_sp.AAC.1